MQKGLATVQVTWYNKCENVVPLRMEHENIQNGRAALLVFSDWKIRTSLLCRFSADWKDGFNWECYGVSEPLCLWTW